MAVFSAVLGQKAAKKASKAMKQAAAQSRADVERGLGFVEPYIESGNRAREQYETALGLRGIDAQREYFQNFQTDPGFQAAVDYGNRGIIQNASALGLRNSGGTLNQLQRHGQLQLSNAFGNRLSALSNLSGQGQNAATTYLGGTGALANTAIQAGNASAYKHIQGFNALSSGIQNTSNVLSNALGFGLGKFG